MQLVVEPLNTLIDHPGYFLTGMEQAVSIVRELANPQVKILADFYHLGVMGEDLSDIARQYAKDIGYVHVADLPGRHEPGTGTVDWKSILRLLGDSGYEGIVGFEYTPHAETDASLRRVAGLWDEIDG
jgi:hydroxypyruvate isomerase